MAPKTKEVTKEKFKGKMSPLEFLKKISKEDQEAVLDLKKNKPIDFISTGSWPIDMVIGDGSGTGKSGGLPRGRIVEIFGDESSGKSTLALSAIRKVQENGGLGMLLDYEISFDKIYAQHLGVDVSSEKLIVTQPKHFQQGARLIKDALLMKPQIIVVDSVSAMIPQQFFEGSVDEAGRIGLQAQLMSTFLSYISKFLQEANTCLLFLNQTRNVIKMNKYDRGPNEDSSGGKALKFYSSLRLKLETSKKEEITSVSRITGKAEKKAVNVLVNVKVVKNKIDKPFMVAPVYIRFGEGFDNIRSIVELAINTNTIKKGGGGNYTFTHDGETLMNAKGMEQVLFTLNNNEALFDKLRSCLVIKEDASVKEEYQEEEEDALKDDGLGSLLESTASSFIEKVEKKKANKEKENLPEND